MRDVRNLFLGGMKVGVICLAVAAVILAVLRKRKKTGRDCISEHIRSH